MLNPQLLRQVTPADSEFVLRLPEGTAERFFAEIAAIPTEKWVSWRRHKVEAGETLSAIAREYRVSPSEIAEANDLPEGSPVNAGQKLIIPAAPRFEATTGKLMRYKVRNNDTVASIADEFDVTTSELRKWNRLKSDHVARGVRLKIYPGGMDPPTQANNKGRELPETPVAARQNGKRQNAVIEARASSRTHHVRSGETLWSIAQAYRTTVEAIRSGNRYLFSRPLQVGDTLTILPLH
jgi:LysM repeat protein